MASQCNRITLILAATSPALGIGKNGMLPWRLKREMKFFRQVTDGSTVVMGRKTWESIPAKFRPLPNRTNIVVSKNPNANYGEGITAATSVDEAFQYASKIARPVFVIGGAQLYKACMKYANTILLTLVEDPESEIDCDTFFEFNKDNWKQLSCSELKEIVGEKVELPENLEEPIEENGFKFRFTAWENANRSN